MERTRRRNASGFWPSAEGVGTLHHVTFCAPVLEHEGRILGAVRQDELEVSEVREHGYFTSIYFRELGDSLLEVATDGPGLTLDEAPENLGSSLTLPPEWEAEREEFEIALPPVTLPGEARPPTRALGWVHRYLPGGGALTLLLHRSGGNETSLLALGGRVAPDAALLSVRGRSLNEGSPRLFRRFDALTDDRVEPIHEADALVQFVRDAARFYGFDLSGLVALGYSNGANALLASLLRNPGAYAGAALLRHVMALAELPRPDLGAKPVLVVGGLHDPFFSLTARVAPYPRALGATVRDVVIDVGHDSAVAG